MFKEEIYQFLAEKHIAFVGASRNKAKFSNKIYEKLKESGHDVHPIHPEMESMQGDACVASVKQLPGDVQALLVVASPKVCANVLKDVSGANIKRIWISWTKKGDPDVEAEIKRLTNEGVSAISGFCPFMFMEPVDSVHGFHRFVVRLFGKYPK
jgi:predicted CoA-binding protein